MLKWILLSVAIILEVGATLLVRVSDGFTRLWPVLGLLAGYTLSFYLDSKVVQLGVPIAITYAIWSAAGIVLVAISARLLFGDPLNLTTIIGMAVLVVGVVITSFGNATNH
ncbi:multidrug efflux SMR transporter [Longispora sp. K20-0274]|uniref:DMT family transporter n=1 Tax=Longispora sp. K20-0274 TaxID=3088255 RepID=UPI003999F139